MSAIEANARVLGDMRLSLLTAAVAVVRFEVMLKKASVTVRRAHSEEFRLSKITIILPDGGPAACERKKDALVATQEAARVGLY